jgi:hypothetical protein
LLILGSVELARRLLYRWAEGNGMIEERVTTAVSALLALLATVAGAVSAARPESLEVLLLLGSLAALSLCRRPGRGPRGAL